MSHDQTALGYGHFYGGASTYTYSLEFAHSDSDVSFGFRGNTDQGWTDEAFAIDNVRVSINSTDVPEPSALALLSLGLLGAFRRKAKNS